MQKGVAPILATVLIVAIVISLSGAFLIYSQRTSTQLTEDATKQQQTLQQRLDVQFILEGVSGSQATLRNIGENAITYGTLSIFLDDVLINYTLPAAIAPGQTGTVYLNQSWKAGLGEKTLRVSGRSLSDSVRVRVGKPGLLMYLNFDEGAGTNAADSTGNSNNGTLTNGPQWVSGRFDDAIQFDGTDDHVSVNSVNPTTAITVEAWVKSDSGTGYTSVWQLVSKYDAYILGTDSYNTNNVCFIVHVNGWRYDSCYAVPNPDAWHHFAGTYDGKTGEKKLYVDGVLRDTDTIVPGTMTPDTGPIAIARRECCSTPSEHFSGTVDEVLIYDRVLAQDELDMTLDDIHVVNRA